MFGSGAMDLNEQDRTAFSPVLLESLPIARVGEASE